MKKAQEGVQQTRLYNGQTSTDTPKLQKGQQLPAKTYKAMLGLSSHSADLARPVSADTDESKVIKLGLR